MVQYKYLVVNGDSIVRWELEGGQRNRTITVEDDAGRDGSTIQRDDGAFDKPPSTRSSSNGASGGAVGEGKPAREIPNAADLDQVRTKAEGVVSDFDLFPVFGTVPFRF